MKFNPSSPNPRKYSEHKYPIGPVFNVGNPEVSSGYVFKGVRYYESDANQDDMRVAKFAGWLALPREENVVDGKVLSHRIELPSSMRSASSALSGLEAWEGEKAEIVDFIVNYVQGVHDNLGGIDIGTNLDTIGVDRGNHTAIAVPPHNLTYDQGMAQVWLRGLVEDFNTVLANEPTREGLIERLETGLGFIGHHDG